MSRIGHQVDWDARRFLDAVKYYGGEATMTEIRRRTGLSRDAANHRFGRLEDLGLIDVTYAEHGHGEREPPKVAHLTGAARREIERGLLRGLDDPRDDGQSKDILSELRALREAVERLENRINAVDESVGALEDDVRTISNVFNEWTDEVTPIILGTYAALDEQMDGLDRYVESARQE